MAIMYIPRQQSPWEQMLPQILGQLALMKVQQNYRAKEKEMELAGKVSLAGGKELTKEETKSPTREGYRRVKLGGKTYSLPLSTEEQLQKQNIFKLGENLYQFKDGGVTRITEKKSQYQPQLFTNEKGDLKWIEPGTKVPEGYTKYTSQKKPTSELSVIAESLGLDLTQPLAPEDAKALVNKVTEIKKDRAKATLLELLLGISQGNIAIQQPTIGGLTPEEQEERERLKVKAGGLQEGYNIIRQPIQ